MARATSPRHLRLMSEALVLLGHADPRSFNAALADRYLAGYRAAGGEATLVRLADLVFDPVLREGHHGAQELEPDLVRLRDAFDRARHVAWFFPTYWVSPPAIVRAVVDRLFLPGWAFRYRENGLPEGLLRGRSARVVTTMDSPFLWYGLVNRRAVHHAFVGGTLSFCGFSPIETTPVYALRTRDAGARAKLLERVFRLGQSDATERARKAALAGAVRSV